MSTVTSAASGASSSSAASASSSSNSANSSLGLTMNDFLKLMITELQNQDPSNPVSDSDMMQEFGDLASINSTTDLDSTLSSMQLGQNLASAGALISNFVTGLDDNGNTQSGVVSSVTINNGSPEVVVNGQTMQLSNVQSVQSSDSSYLGTLLQSLAGSGSNVPSSTTTNSPTTTTPTTTTPTSSTPTTPTTTSN